MGIENSLLSRGEKMKKYVKRVCKKNAKKYQWQQNRPGGSCFSHIAESV
ncbi:hypothetical protein RINTU1_14070 [Candidatus Regiella insecticola]|uniref:Uncharacterized protein n=1 Tax=Candidatus Regiella insecticola TaxID=138073 RepID=A0A6L2ZNM4_9ENTR|nr:hypothetical protein RINTU1_14070 [Candidatus Regiella insecticola]